MVFSSRVKKPKFTSLSNFLIEVALGIPVTSDTEVALIEQLSQSFFLTLPIILNTFSKFIVFVFLSINLSVGSVA